MNCFVLFLEFFLYYFLRLLVLCKLGRIVYLDLNDQKNTRFREKNVKGPVKIVNRALLPFFKQIFKNLITKLVFSRIVPIRFQYVLVVLL